MFQTSCKVDLPETKERKSDALVSLAHDAAMTITLALNLINQTQVESDIAEPAGRVRMSGPTLAEQISNIHFRGNSVIIICMHTNSEY